MLRGRSENLGSATANFFKLRRKNQKNVHGIPSELFCGIFSQNYSADFRPHKISSSRNYILLLQIVYVLALAQFCNSINLELRQICLTE